MATTKPDDINVQEKDIHEKEPQTGSGSDSGKPPVLFFTPEIG